MKLVSVVKELGLKTHCGANLSDEVVGGYVGDLLSDVMAGATEGQIWITRQIHPNIIAVAALKELAERLIEAIDRRLWTPKSNSAMFDLSRLSGSGAETMNGVQEP